MSVVEARGVSCSIGGTAVLTDVDLTVGEGEVLGLLGPNGAGKSTLMRLLAGLRHPDRGSVTLDGAPLRRVGRREAARRIAIVEQSPEAHTEITVAEAVELGRTPYRGAFGSLRSPDREAVDAALEATGMQRFRDRAWSTLSGGERQRAQLARALAQQPTILLLDEPTNHLDVRYQLETLKSVRGLGITAVAALHDLNLAARFCDSLLVLDRGTVVAHGRPDDVLNPRLLREVYEVDAVVDRSPHTDSPVATFLSPADRDSRGSH